MSIDPIVEFLRARLDEDERIARAAGAGKDRPGAGVWNRDCGHVGFAGEDLPPAHDLCCVVSGDIHIYDEGGHDSDDAAHIARHDPARVLRDVEAKRAIIERLVEVVADPVNYDYAARSLAEDVLRLLAAVYDQHPDYREEWKP